MPLLKYFGLGGKLSCRGAVRRELVLIRADCPFAAFRPADQEDQQNEWYSTPVAGGWHLPKTSHKVKSLVKGLLQSSGLTQSRRLQKWDVSCR
jgi:hypothetical protein